MVDSAADRQRKSSSSCGSSGVSSYFDNDMDLAVVEAALASVHVSELELVRDNAVAEGVWLFRGVLHGNAVFVKVPQTADECRAEVEILQRLKGRAPVPAVLAVVPVGDDRLALVMPLYEPISREVGWCWLARQLFGALASVHEANVIHCDVKPRHLMLQRQRLDDGGGENSSLVLCDFGLAVEVESSAAGKKGWPCGLRGTTPYMAPEVQSNEAFGFQADIFSAGVTLRRLLERWHVVEEPAWLRRLMAADPRSRPTAMEAMDLACQDG